MLINNERLFENYT